MCELAKGRRPVIPLAERLEIVSHISYVDQAIAEDVPDKIDTWRRSASTSCSRATTGAAPPKGEKLERGLRRGRCRGRLLPVHDAHLEQHAAPGAGGHRSAARRASRRPAEPARTMRRAKPTRCVCELHRTGPTSPNGGADWGMTDRLTDRIAVRCQASRGRRGAHLTNHATVGMDSRQQYHSPRWSPASNGVADGPVIREQSTMGIVMALTTEPVVSGRRRPARTCSPRDHRAACRRRATADRGRDDSRSRFARPQLAPSRCRAGPRRGEPVDTASLRRSVVPGHRPARPRCSPRSWSTCSIFRRAPTAPVDPIDIPYAVR